MQSDSFFFDNRKLARARDDECCEFRIMHQIKFQCLIQGHHMYKNAWSPYKRETLIAQSDNRGEAQENDKYAVGIYKENDDRSKELIAKRKHEVGLVVPAKYNAFTRNKKIAMVLDKELANRKKLYKSCLELIHQWKNIYRMIPVYQ